MRKVKRLAWTFLVGLVTLAASACSSNGGGGEDDASISSDVPVSSLELRIASETETSVTLDWDTSDGEDYELWALDVHRISDIVDFPEPAWERRWEGATPPFEVERMLDNATEIRCVLRATMGDGAIVGESEVVSVHQARCPMAPVVAVGDGVAWLGWDTLAGGAQTSLIGSGLVDWQIVRDGSVVDTIPPHTGAYDPPIGYLDLSGVLAGQTVSYQVGRLSINGDTGPESEPTEVLVESWVGLDGMQDHSCALAASGAVYCWGDNHLGQLGAGDREEHFGAVSVMGPGGTSRLSDVEDVAVGERSTCALLQDGTVSCWGRDLRSPDTVLLHPEQLELGATPEDIELGGAFACALNSGELWCLGANESGQLGRGTQDESPQGPAQVLGPDGTAPLAGVEQWGAGFDHMCALVDTGDVYCWGLAAQGQLGLGEVGDPVPLPARVAVEGAESLWVGPLGACVWTADDRFWCWGDDFHFLNTMTGEGRSDPADRTPDDYLQAGEVVVAAVPGKHSYMVTSLGRVFDHYRFVGLSWELCDQGPFTPPFSGTTLLSKGEDYACLLNRDGLLVCRAWCTQGFNTYEGCAGSRPGTWGLNTYQRADAVRVVLEQAP